MTLLELFTGVGLIAADDLALLSFIGSAIIFLGTLVNLLAGRRVFRRLWREFVQWSVGALLLGTVCFAALQITGSTATRIGLIWGFSPATVSLLLLSSFFLLLVNIALSLRGGRRIRANFER